MAKNLDKKSGKVNIKNNINFYLSLFADPYSPN